MVGVQCFQLGKNLGGHGLGIAGIGVHPADAPVATEPRALALAVAARGRLDGLHSLLQRGVPIQR